jgi:hypothetical protein
MDSKSLLALVSKAAPLLGSVLGGPLAGVATTLIAAAFNTPNDHASILTALTTNAQASEKLKEIEYKHQEALLAIQQQDLASARLMNQSTVRVVLIIVLCIAFLLVGIVGFFFRNVPEVLNIVIALLTVLGIEARDTFRFYFGINA